MGYLGRRIGLSQDQGDSNPSGANGAVGGGLQDLFENGYFNRQGKISNDAGVAASGIEASGGVISDYTESNGKIYRAHIFNSSGELDVTAIGAFGNSTEYLVVAGGGSGGYEGGGGAGGVRTNLDGHPLSTNNPAFNVTAGVTYTITVGGGGNANIAGPSGSPSNGTPSQIIAPGPTVIVTSTGGGGAGNYPGIDGRFGGSGGGSGTTPSTAGFGINPSTPAPLGGPFPHTEGHPGGAYTGAPYAGHGGGGAGGPGHPPAVSPGGSGGEGVQVLIAGPNTTRGIGGPGPGSQEQWYGGGGGGGRSPGPGAGGGMGPHPAPYAGGGRGAQAGPGEPLMYGVMNTGGGGGGLWNGNTGNAGGGGSGIVIVRYQIGSVAAAAKATGGAISYYNDMTIHTFVNSGTFETNANWTAADVEYVIVGGGGAGGEHRYRGGGGGAGGYRTGSIPIGAHPVSKVVQVGAGGVGRGHSQPTNSGNGNPSFFGPPVSVGGGGMGGTWPDYPGIQGVSGGGGGGGPSPSSGGSSTGDTFPGNANDDSPANGWGYPGGANNDTPIGAGGGGAGGAGQPNNPNSTPTRGLGGPGVQVPDTFRNPKSAPGPGGGGIGTPGPAGGFYLAGGGNAGGYGSGGNPLVATSRPAGGGGFGGNQDTPNYAGGENALANTGGGGGGASSTDSSKTSGMGGSGIVLIAYPS